MAVKTHARVVIDSLSGYSIQIQSLTIKSLISEKSSNTALEATYTDFKRKSRKNSIH